MASSIVASAAKQLGSLLVDEAKSLYKVSEKIDRLQHDLQWMHCFLEDADNRQHSEKHVALWVSDIRDFAYEAEEIIEKYVHKVSHPRQNGKWNTIKWLWSALGDSKALHDVGSNIDDLRSRIPELALRLQLYGIKITKEEQIRVANMREQRQTYCHIEEDPVGLEEHTTKVVHQLVKNEHVKVVGISGMGGLGKTTLARKAFQHKDTMEHFKSRVWVCISKQFEVGQVYREILKDLTIAKDANEMKKVLDISDVQVAQKISDILNQNHLSDVHVAQKISDILNQNPCLVVLDDVWSNGDWDALKPAFESIRSSHSKILVTTRMSVLVQDATSFDYSHQLNLLDDEDSWRLFQRITFPKRTSAEKSIQLAEIEFDQTKEEVNIKSKEKLGREMLKHCEGLPLAIITLGGVLCEKKSITEWETVQKNITAYLMGDLKQHSDIKGLFAVLELSYNDLPNYLKQCFMYLGHFPEDYRISTERLYHLWEAEGLVKIPAMDSYEFEDINLDDFAELYLMELVKRSLVQVVERWANGRIKYCRLHDVMRDMCLKKCTEVNFLRIIKREQFFSKEPSSMITSSSRVDRTLRRCALYLGETKDDDPLFDLSQNVASYIRSLLVFTLGEVKGWLEKELLTQTMCKSLLLLRVIDLESTRSIPFRPKTAKDFIHLRYLSFKDARFHIEKLDIWDCKFLETLDLRVNHAFGCKFSNKFWKLERLRHLYLPWVMFIRGSEKLFLTDVQLGQMETLRNFSRRACQVMDLKKMTSLRSFSTTRVRNEHLHRNEVEHLLDSPMIARKRLARPLHMRVMVGVINEGTPLLTTMQSLVCISGFDINGRIQELGANLDILHNVYMTKLELRRSEIEQQTMSVLEKLPYLKTLLLDSKSIVGNKLSFSNGGFLQLKKLLLNRLEDLEEWTIEKGALPNLQHLTTYQCSRLKMIPHNLPKSVIVHCKFPCVRGVEKYNVCPYA